MQAMKDGVVREEARASTGMIDLSPSAERKAPI